MYRIVESGFVAQEIRPIENVDVEFHHNFDFLLYIHRHKADAHWPQQW